MAVTRGCGTKIYASPEQLSTESDIFDHRADIYSLGVIMLQLFYPMSTSMEFIIILNKLKKDEVPSDLVKYCGEKIAAIIALCL